MSVHVVSAAAILFGALVFVSIYSFQGTVVSIKTYAYGRGRRGKLSKFLVFAC